METADKAVRDFFDTEAGGYATKHYQRHAGSFIGIRQDRILDLVDGLPLANGARALDAGCGPGLLTVDLARRGLEVHGLDFSAGMLREAAHYQDAALPSCRPALVQGDVERLPYEDGAFDLVCSAGVIEYLPADEPSLREFRRVLRPGGFLIVSTTKTGAPVGWLDPLVEALKRRRAVLAMLGRWRAWHHRPLVQARHFPLRRHRPSELGARLEAYGFELREQRFFYHTPWPHPLDRMLPAASAATERRLAPGRSRFGRFLAAGFVTLSRRRD
jgi:ubiquinone/menaquinone biosynthesis C-methylase UbiE